MRKMMEQKGVVRDGGGGDLDTAGVERVLQSLQRCT